MWQTLSVTRMGNTVACGTGVSSAADAVGSAASAVAAFDIVNPDVWRVEPALSGKPALYRHRQ
jgi:hypothetical protein